MVKHFSLEIMHLAHKYALNLNCYRKPERGFDATSSMDDILYRQSAAQSDLSVTVFCASRLFCSPRSLVGIKAR